MAPASRRLGYAQKLNQQQDYQAVFKSGQVITVRGFRVFAKKTDLGHARLGLAISRRQLARAVDRNRLKRLVRESFRQHQSELDSFDVVVTAHRSARALAGRTLLNSLAEAWGKLAEN